MDRDEARNTDVFESAADSQNRSTATVRNKSDRCSVIVVARSWPTK